ncbi:HIT domain-containing protein [Natrialba sp. INN-245]|uniref:HIT family protein n=1 Tax=Natrialba sp. INN-245 TaxID=2690967 RepID=UPI001311B915|nr:HIT domain-containing protein [Natrialba sp. INN-245]MWV40907.1 HIT domain-containing protein [Natrialba sp. INN-245]
MDDDCTFCRIVAGDGSVRVVYEDERTVAFLDRRPATTGHTLVAPRVHEEELLTTDASATHAVFRTVETVSTALEETLDPDGFSLFHTSGPLVGTVEHAHVHLVPRFEDDDVSLSLPRDRLTADDGAELAARIRERL